MTTVLDNMLKENFIISICGQMNSGKSSFLNYLLFKRDNILPVDPTPWTAKLTKVHYGERDYIEIFFYTKSEWEELKQLEVETEEVAEDDEEEEW